MCQHWVKKGGVSVLQNLNDSTWRLEFQNTSATYFTVGDDSSRIDFNFIYYLGYINHVVMILTGVVDAAGSVWRSRTLLILHVTQTSWAFGSSSAKSVNKYRNRTACMWSRKQPVAVFHCVLVSIISLPICKPPSLWNQLSSLE